MSKALKRQFTAWERVELCNALDNCAGKGFSSISDCLTEVCAHFERLGRSNEDKLTIEQIRNDLSSLARQCQNGSRSLEKFLRGWDAHKKVIRKSAATSYAAELRKLSATAPAAQTPKPTLRETSTSTDIEQGSQPSLSPVRKDDGEYVVEELSSDGDVSDAPSPKALPKSHQTKEVDEESDTQDNNQEHGGLINIQVDRWELNILAQLRAQRGTVYYSPPPAHQHVKGTVRGAFLSLAQGVQHFLEAFPGAVLSSSTMSSENSLALARIMLNLQDSHKLERRLGALFTGPKVITKNVLLAYATAAIFEWLLCHFEECLQGIDSKDCQQCAVFEICGQVNTEAVKSLKISRQIQYLDKVVGPGLPDVAAQNLKRLSDLFQRLITPAAVTATQYQTITQPKISQQGSLAIREGHLLQWEQHIEKAFLDLLELRLLMAKSICLYDFQLPSAGEVFDPEWMEVPAHLNKPAEEGSEAPEKRTVYLCLRPAIYSYKRVRIEESTKVLVVPALVLLE